MWRRVGRDMWENFNGRKETGNWYNYIIISSIKEIISRNLLFLFANDTFSLKRNDVIWQDGQPLPCFESHGFWSPQCCVFQPWSLCSMKTKILFYTNTLNRINTIKIIAKGMERKLCGLEQMLFFQQTTAQNREMTP